ncbi:hypothetical protein HY36_12180 [Hyphomonas atlantica]|uniref:Schlafen group 3-like DNA/RNA helicase domain-containing protein n=1 Tax=Hyphomonas atlantica TaxID=1280948 RepID=A0A059EA67_9PROT|nr:hypothetical protein HY36_12180 [Hyphomonas atlantica]
MIAPAYYQAPIDQFLNQSVDEILGQLTAAHGFALELTQRDAWKVQVELLQDQLRELDHGEIFFEFAIPRMGKRADVVLLLDGTVFVVEFKVGASSFDRSAIDQVHDYALDLKNFHKGSHGLPIVPILIATRAPRMAPEEVNWAKDHVAAPILSSGKELIPLLHGLVPRPVAAVDAETWIRSGYLPTPTIIEAAQALYQNHSVEEIARSDAGAQNLTMTTECIRQIVADARANRKKAICFVTGVPGSGKTLAGLNIATESSHEDEEGRAVFLSGNGPLVIVLREALARDQVARLKVKKGDALREVSSFVQNIHHFRDEALRLEAPPPEHIVIFDEAQRAWTRDQASKFMQQKRGQANFDMSEPQFLVSVMDRHADWAVIICLVGGGQEINTGEAGLAEWMGALQAHYPDWEVHVSERLHDPDYGLSEHREGLLGSKRVTWEAGLHLGVSMRSFRAEKLSEFVGHILDNRPEEARRVYAEIKDRYPIALTRDIDAAREWLRQHARGTERPGLIASSGAYRLRPDGINVRASIDPANWFLNGPDDVRSAYYLEEVATEFDVQGLELDWAGICWDADLRYEDGAWRQHAFKGTRWQSVNSPERRLYLKNAYRVILTRARQGMILYIPQGVVEDKTRHPHFYDGIAAYLMRCGLG